MKLVFASSNCYAPNSGSTATSNNERPQQGTTQEHRRMINRGPPIYRTLRTWPRLAIISLIAAHLRSPESKYSWGAHIYDFSGAVFDGGDFSGATISGEVSFAGATFSGGLVNLSRVTFAGHLVSFYGATFSGGEVSFSNAVFSAHAVTFVEATFSGGQVDFNGATFAKPLAGRWSWRPVTIMKEEDPLRVWRLSEVPALRLHERKDHTGDRDQPDENYACDS